MKTRLIAVVAALVAATAGIAVIDSTLLGRAEDTIQFHVLAELQARR